MPDDKLIEVYLNPLQFLELDELWASVKSEEVRPEAIFDFLCSPGIGSKIEDMVSRYREISIEEARLFAAPNEQRILDKLIWPLRHAKAGYMCGNYLGTIALCGMVSEMVAILLFEISDFKLNNQPMSEKDQKAVFGSKFEKLGQERRIQILSSYCIIDDKINNSFNAIRDIRRRYLHLWSEDHNRLSSDAIICYKAAINVVVSVIGQNIEDGKIILNPSIMRHLDKHGQVKDMDE
jgi:hypothetical protein